MTYLYDANGNMTSDGTKCYEYNDANQLKKVKKCADNKTIAEYVYDHTGKRIIKKEYENGTFKRTVYSPSDEYETVVLASNGAKLNTTYYKVNDEVVAKKNPDGTINYYHNDHLGSNSVLTDQSGAVVEKTTYQPYGEVKSGGTKSKFGYTGQEKDQETGLNYYDSRYYDPHLQRFVQPDTLLPDVYDPQQLNRYSYARNNPLTYNDPTGHFVSLGSLIGTALRWIAGTSVGRAVVKTAASLPIVKSVVQAVAKNPNVQQITQKTQPIVNAVQQNQAAMTVINNVDGVQAGARNLQQTFNAAKATTGTIYRAANQLPTYVGKTIDLARRSGEWARKGRVIEPIKGLENVPLEHLSGVEQAVIENVGLNNLSNIRNAISPNNPKYQGALEIGNQYIDDLEW